MKSGSVSPRHPLVFIFLCIPRFFPYIILYFFFFSAPRFYMRMANRVHGDLRGQFLRGVSPAQTPQPSKEIRDLFPPACPFINSAAFCFYIQNSRFPSVGYTELNDIYNKNVYNFVLVYSDGLYRSN